MSAIKMPGKHKIYPDGTSGHYTCECVECKTPFWGHKRDNWCGECKPPPPVVMSAALIEKIRDGDPLSDHEVYVAERHFKQVCELLKSMGPRWDMAWTAAFYEWDRLDRIKTARSRK